MINSLLAIREWPAGPAARPGVVVALHREGGDVDQLADLAGACGLRVVAAEAPRPVIAHNADRSGPFEGYSWYPAVNGEATELTRFGHALCCLEELVLTLMNEDAGDGPDIFLLGEGQGGALALTYARVAPSTLAGVIAIDAALPRTPGWAPPEANLDGLPILLAGTAEADAATVDILATSGAAIETVRTMEGHDLAGTIARWTEAQR